ncbi:aminotransferase class V-fold PLP-dependent enzyme [Aeromicrobium sp. YIM 150415]|uniref:aminotransferase class V-fold PLP-dependent enzyme n=1 Tax=Aeromicrobium sp. YIM 150415 TaxID=2803912 RepID=UPI001965F440|nr:aminotransferase class V-fold PLP-dependent enzyme [Aeromicrobium sp. YIM 150415]MBM9461868.1 aminotransferase class V-fold PLP-dependent enzyme [Aeromicrobium sp. YIM 150415]
MNRPLLPATTPLPIISSAQAWEAQQRLVAAVAEHLPDGAVFRSDAGVVPGLGQPDTTRRVERALAQTFGADDACLVQGAGTGAIRAALSAGPWAEGSRRLIVHDAPDYSTTATTFRDGLVEPVRVDFEDIEAVRRAFEEEPAAWVYVQHTRQRLGDAHQPAEVIALAAEAGRRVIVDDNYAVFRAPRIGAELGADVSAFSLFKLHGPEGVGVVVGAGDVVERVRHANYSGGGQVQGHQALAALQALVMVPLNWAAQAQASVELAASLSEGGVPGIVDARLANVQDLCVIALLDEPVAEHVPQWAAEHGAARFPVGSNSRYEITPLVYRLSSSTLEAQPELREWAVRVNPMRAGAGLTADILRRALAERGA